MLMNIKQWKIKINLKSNLTCNIYKGERLKREAVLDDRTHFKPTEIFQYTNHSACHQVPERFYQRRGSKTTENKLKYYLMSKSKASTNTTFREVTQKV